MTKCSKSEINLKSTAYNQNGQNYFEQLTAYNSMSSHLRRVLLAKCVVDARNKNYTCKRKQLLKQSDRKSRSVTTEITNDIIDKLAFDTLHHPVDFLRISCDSRYMYQREDEKYFTDCYDYNVICSQSRLHNHVICPNFSMFRANKSESFISNDRPKKRETAKSEFKIKDDPEHRYEKGSVVYESASDFLTQKVNHLSMAVNSARKYDLHDGYRNYEIAKVFANTITNHKMYVKDEEKRYAKFVYEITNEIMQNGLYTDKDLQEVFKKHLERNEGFLDMNKMLYEIYQLKIALNILDDSGDEELEDIRTRPFLSTSRVRPPTPPKVLNENKVIEKLVSYQKGNNTARSNCNKTVLCIDANPELRITERDVLTSLIEANITPEQAHKIYKRLSVKSKDILPTHLIMTTTERPNDELATLENNSSLNESNNVHKISEEKSSTTNDLITHRDKDVQA